MGSPKNKMITVRYKIIVSILFGLAGFFINFFGINFHFGENVASFLPGLILPMIIALAWGWKYGLLSATLGLGCQTMWFLWMPSSGYAPFVTVPMFSLWIAWHGWSSWKHKETGLKRWNPYAAEIPFRIFNTMILYTLTKWIVQFNPPSWAPEAVRVFPLSFVNFLVIKELVNAYIILLIVDVLLNLGFVRKLLRLEPKFDQTNTSYIISFSILLGCMFWIIDSFVNYFVFPCASASLLDSIVLDVSPHDLFTRSAFILACLIGGLISSRFLHSQRESEQKLKKAHSMLEAKVKSRTEELQDAYIKLKELDKQKDIFISIAAHELKTPLTSIRGFVQVLADKSHPLDKNKKDKYFQLINKNTKRLYELILDLLDSTRLNLGKIKMDMRKLDVADIFKEIKDNFEIIIKEKGITPIYQYEKELPYIYADMQRVIQVLRNLIINAVHATGKGGVISLIVRRKGNFVLFEVKDTGLGIPKKNQKNLFSKFYQAGDSYRRISTGTGLGLSICKGMVELMNGKIWFESKLGKGSRFYFTLPIAHKINKRAKK